MRTSGVLYRIVGSAVVAIAAASVTLGATASPASALPRNCASLEDAYIDAANRANYWWGEYQQGLSTNVDRAVGVAYPNYQDAEADRIDAAHPIMDFC